MMPESTNTSDNRRPVRHDIYTDPKIAEAANSNDPLSAFLRQYWRPLVTVLIAVLVGVYFVNTFRDSYDESMRGAADIFQRVQSEYQSYLRLNDELALSVKEAAEKKAKPESKDNKNAADSAKPADEKVESLKKQVQEKRSSLDQLLKAAADTREPYITLAGLYRGLALRAEGTTEALAALEPLRGWQNIGKAGSPERFYAELGALTLARTELDQPDHLERGRALLKQLALDSQFVNSAAATALAQISISVEERKEANDTLHALIAKHPEQAEVLKDELNRLK